ncbi:hypothetical protein [Pseudohongiella acticola]|uniref:hypothetical protein n=1 Tax=Pseudohongiella acticola TaxID=1524254 RepID=UPI0011131BF3|nr:hypothetical protein [Pseudohongiella acticola]
MIKRCFIIAITLMIALQSLVSIAYEEQLHHASAPHHEHSLASADIEREVHKSNSSQNESHHSSADCHHNHNCFHMGLVIPQTSLPAIAEASVVLVYRASLLKGIHPPLLRPPIA